MRACDAQAWGNILSLAALLFFLGVFGQRSAPYNPTLLSLTWRLQYGLGLLPILYMLYHRIFRLQESAHWKVRARAVLPLNLILAWCLACEFHTTRLCVYYGSCRRRGVRVKELNVARRARVLRF